MASDARRTGLLTMACGAMFALAACGGDAESTPGTAAGGLVPIGSATTFPAPSTTLSPVAIAPVVPTVAAPIPSGMPAPPDELLMPGLAALDEPVRTYGWTGDARPTRDDFEALADALGVSGEIGEGPAGGWVLDGDNLTLTMDGGIEGAWSFSGPPPFAWPSENEPWPTNETGEPVTIAPAFPTPGAPLPDTFPSQDEAHALARGIVTSMGLDPSAFEWRDGPRHFAAGVEAWWAFGGIASPVKLEFGFGPDDALLFAFGQTVAPQVGPEVARIGTVAAEERLRAEIERLRTVPFGGGDVLIGGVVATGEPDTQIVLSDPSVTTVPSAPLVNAAGQPMTTPPGTTVAAESIGRMVEVQASWQVVREDAGTRLLPAYTFVEATGMRYTVSAVG